MLLSEVYDLADLRARMALVFSASELRELASRLGMNHLAVERGTHEAARDIIRFVEKGVGVGSLVRALREARPLVEWPEPTMVPIPPRAGMNPNHGGAHDDSASRERITEPGVPPEALRALSSDPGEHDAPDQPRTGAPDIRPDGHDSVAQLRAIPDPFIAGSASHGQPPRQALQWPGVAAPQPAAAKSGFESRILVGVSAMTLLAAVVAFVAGRAWSGDDNSRTAPSAPTSSARSASVGSPSPRDPDGLAGRAALAVGRSLGNVARICEVPTARLTARSDAPVGALDGAFARCGPEEFAPPARTRELPPTAAAAGASDPAEHPNSDGPKRPRADDAPRAPRPVAPQTPPPQPEASDGCLRGCQGAHAQCKSACGPEPTQSSRYGDWQACNGRCLTAHSKCRLSCP